MRYATIASRFLGFISGCIDLSVSLSLCLFARARAVFVLVNHLSHFTCGLQKLALTVFIARARRVVALLSHARTTTQ
jgi:hypothetical protein